MLWFLRYLDIWTKTDNLMILRVYYFFRCDIGIVIMVGIKENSPLRDIYKKILMKWYNIWDLFQSNMRRGGMMGDVNGTGLALIG